MLRKLLPIVNVKMLCMVYFAHFYSHISCGIVFWGLSSSKRNVFIIQKRAIRIMLRLGPRSSCREGYLQFLVYIFMPPCYLYMCYLERDCKIRIASNLTGFNCKPPNQRSIECCQNISLLMSITYPFLGYLIDFFIFIELLTKAKTNTQFSS